MADRYSWLTDLDPRPDRSIRRGTPYDSAFRPKKPRDAVGDAFRAAPIAYNPVRSG